MTQESDEESPPPGQDKGRLAPLPAGVLAVAAILGLFGGWSFRRVADSLLTVAPLVSWTQVGVLFFVAAILGALAWATWRTIHVRAERVEAQHMVNRLVLARACAVVGALVAGGYAGYAVSWLGLSAELAGERIARSLVAAVGGVAITISALLLERACRVRKDDPRA